MLHTVREVSRAHDSGRHYVSQSRQRTHCNTSSYQWGRPQAWGYVHSKLVQSWLVAMGNIRSRLTGRVWAAHHARHAPHTPPPPVQCRAVREHGWLASEGTGCTWRETWSEHTLSCTGSAMQQCQPHSHTLPLTAHTPPLSTVGSEVTCMHQGRSLGLRPQ